ncbi:MAG TPA: AI-2E family transporter [Longimicrobiaceae bacterium]|nr:AI-2E family transporter [Longimicrobiaceae bacterium]
MARPHRLEPRQESVAPPAAPFAGTAVAAGPAAASGYPRRAATWTIVGLGITIAIALLPFGVGLLGAAALYVVCAPAHRSLTPLIGARAAAALVLLGALILMLIPAAVLLTLAMDEAPAILRALPAGPLSEHLARLRVGGVQVGSHLLAVSDALVTWASQRLVLVFGSIARTVLNLVIAFFGLYYLLVARRGTWERARRYLPFSPANADRLRARFYSVTEATLLGVVLTALLQGSLVGGGFWLVGLPNALFWGIVTGLVSVLPVLGSAIVWFPGVLVLVFAARYGAAVGLAVIGGGIASNVDNLVRLAVFKRVSNIHPMITLVGAFAGVRYMGLVGVLLGPLAISYFFELLRVYRDEHEGTGPTGGAPAPRERGSAPGSGESANPR